MAGSRQTVTWTVEHLTGNVVVEYSKDGFSSDSHDIATVAAAAGSAEWTIPNDPSDTVRVRVRAEEDEGIEDLSDQEFSISACPIQVTSPDGGEEWEVSSLQLITWTVEDATGYVAVEYSKDGFASDILTIAVVLAENESLLWQVPDDPSTTARIRVRFDDDSGIGDVSDSDFSIVEPTSP